MALAKAAQKARKKSTKENRNALDALSAKIETLSLFSETATNPGSSPTDDSSPTSGPSQVGRGRLDADGAEGSTSGRTRKER